MDGSAAAPRPRIVLLVLLLLLAAFALHAVRFGHYVNDDAYITFRYSRSLATGNGPYFNSGEHVEGYTNPLLMLLLAAVYRLAGPGALPGAAKGIGIVAGAGCVAVAFALSRRLAAALELPPPWRDAAGLCAAAVAAASPGFAVNSVSGLETAPFALLIAGGALTGVAAIEGRWRGSGLLFAAAYLMRPDGVVAFAVFWVMLAATGLARGERRLIRPLLIDAAIVTLVVVLHLASRYVLYDHEWLPNTYYAKLGGDSDRTGWRYVLDGTALPFAGWAVLVLGLCGLARTRGRAWTSVAPVLAWPRGERCCPPFSAPTGWPGTGSSPTTCPSSPRRSERAWPRSARCFSCGRASRPAWPCSPRSRSSGSHRTASGGRSGRPPVSVPLDTRPGIARWPPGCESTPIPEIWSPSWTSASSATPARTCASWISPA